jgi:hypothetical protein
LVPACAYFSVSVESSTRFQPSAWPDKDLNTRYITAPFDDFLNSTEKPPLWRQLFRSININIGQYREKSDTESWRQAAYAVVDQMIEKLIE